MNLHNIEFTLQQANKLENPANSTEKKRTLEQMPRYIISGDRSCLALIMETLLLNFRKARL